MSNLRKCDWNFRYLAITVSEIGKWYHILFCFILQADAIKTYTETSLNVNLKNLENILSKNDGIHMVGNKVNNAGLTFTYGFNIYL